MAKLKDYQFEMLINMALDTGDKEYFKELTYKQEHGLFEEYDDAEQAIDISERDQIIAEFERLNREITGIINRQYMQSLQKFKQENEDNMKGRYELFIDSVSDAIICSFMRYEDDIVAKGRKRLPAPKEEDNNDVPRGERNSQRGTGEKKEEE